MTPQTAFCTGEVTPTTSDSKKLMFSRLWRLAEIRLRARRKIRMGIMNFRA
jgi:hypothetical protein